MRSVVERKLEDIERNMGMILSKVFQPQGFASPKNSVSTCQLQQQSTNLYLWGADIKESILNMMSNELRSENEDGIKNKSKEFSWRIKKLEKLSSPLQDSGHALPATKANRWQPIVEEPALKSGETVVAGKSKRSISPETSS